jgi:alkylation response protein AidB-like acyl-CoA dehydrogenase
MAEGFKKGATAAVGKYLQERVGLTVYADDIANDLGLTRVQTMQAVQRALDKGLVEAEKLQAGVWRVGRSKSTGRLFELLGESKQGKLVIQDDEGNLFVAESL